MTIRSNTAKMAVVALLAAGLAVALMVLLFPGKGTSAGPTYSALVRLAAQYDMFDGNEFNTQEEPSADAGGGQAIFDTVVYAPASANVLYVTVSGTGDAHYFCNDVGPKQQCGQARILLACLVNNVPCNNGPGDANGVTGWVTLQNPTDDLHDNGIYYTWCKAITPGTGPRHVTVKMASSNTGDVYMETTHFFVDASQIAPHGCAQAATPEGVGGGEPVGPKQP